MIKDKWLKSSAMILSLGLVVSFSVSGIPPIDHAEAEGPEKSTFFSTSYIEESDSLNTESQGDLWASCWSDDDYLYAANGDGDGFTVTPPNTVNTPPGLDHLTDIAINKIAGVPGELTGEAVAESDQIGQIWNDSQSYNRKPTGMACVNGDLYLAVQDLNKDFNDVPSATVVKSTDKGKTWSWDKTKPMFDDHIFTTMMFLDYGKDYENAIDKYVYVYGLDHNWRDSFNDRVEDPTKLYLARVPQKSVTDRSTWEFYSGKKKGKPTWSKNINEKQPILQDERRIYQDTFTVNSPKDMTVISQGSVVYNKPLKRYIYTSWTEYTFEFYEAPTPWGPWKHFMTKDYGGYPWSDTKNGGYATTIPSKFISDDGKTMYVQSNTFMGGAANYNFSLRKLTVEPNKPSKPTNEKNIYQNLAIIGEGTTPINKVAHFGNVEYLNNNKLDESEDSWNNENKSTDWWGYTWNKNYNMNMVNYTTGNVYPDGGWFDNMKVQVRQNFEWVDVSNLTGTPDYPNNNNFGINKTYTFTFDDTWGDGIRIIGKPGGSMTFTSIAELAVSYGYDGQSNSRPFTIENGKISTSDGILGSATLKRSEGVSDHKGQEVVVFELWKNKKRVDFAAIKKDITTLEEMSAFFSNIDNSKKYKIKMFVVQSLDEYQRSPKIAERLSNEVELSDS
jgi:hypothetical protein